MAEHGLAECHCHCFATSNNPIVVSVQYAQCQYGVLNIARNDFIDTDFAFAERKKQMHFFVDFVKNIYRSRLYIH